MVHHHLYIYICLFALLLLLRRSWKLALACGHENILQHWSLAARQMLQEGQLHGLWWHLVSEHLRHRRGGPLAQVPDGLRHGRVQRPRSLAWPRFRPKTTQ